MFEMKKNYYFSISFVLEKLHVFKSYFSMKSKTKMNRANWLIPILASFVILNCAFQCTPDGTQVPTVVTIDGWGTSSLHSTFDYGFDMGDMLVDLGGPDIICSATGFPPTVPTKKNAVQLHSAHIQVSGEAFLMNADASGDDKFYVKFNTGRMTFRIRTVNPLSCNYDDKSVYWDATINFSYRYKAIYFSDPDQYCITKSRIDWDNFTFSPINGFNGIDAISNWIKNDNEKVFIAATDKAVAHIMTSKFKQINLPDDNNGRCLGHSAWTQLP